MLTALQLPERRPGATLLVVGVLFACAYGASLVWLAKPGGRIVFGDALYHYVQLRSIVFDRDVRFTNEYLHMYGLTPETVDAETRWVIDTDASGHVRNLMPVGPALLWMPAFLVACAGVWIANLFGAGYPLDGYGRVFQAAAAFSGIAAATVAAWFAYLAARTRWRSRAAIWATLAVWLGSSTVYYSAISPMYSHAASMCAVSAFWFAWLRTRHQQTPARYVMVGALVGVAALMRWQDAMLLTVPALEAVWESRGRVARLVVLTGCASAAAALAFVPQMFIWQRLYGHPFTIPQGAAFMRWTEPALWQVLFSDNHGLFTWTPVLAVATAGLVLVARRDPGTAAVSAIFLLISWYVNASVADWWAGEAFGARRFVGCFPVFVLGMAAIFDRWHDRPARILVTTAVFVGLTFLLLAQYQLFMHGWRHLAPYPRGLDGLWIARFRLPIDLVRHIAGSS